MLALPPLPVAQQQVKGAERGRAVFVFSRLAALVAAWTGLHDLTSRVTADHLARLCVCALAMCFIYVQNTIR